MGMPCIQAPREYRQSRLACGMTDCSEEQLPAETADPTDRAHLEYMRIVLASDSRSLSGSQPLMDGMLRLKKVPAVALNLSSPMSRPNSDQKREHRFRDRSSLIPRRCQSLDSQRRQLANENEQSIDIEDVTVLF